MSGYRYGILLKSDPISCPSVDVFAVPNERIMKIVCLIQLNLYPVGSLISNLAIAKSRKVYLNGHKILYMFE